MFRHNLTAAAVLAALSSVAFAAETEQAVDLETVHVSGQRSYNAISTEKDDEYSSSAVTVGTKIPGIFARYSAIHQHFDRPANQRPRCRYLRPTGAPNAGHARVGQ